MLGANSPQLRDERRNRGTIDERVASRSSAGGWLRVVGLILAAVLAVGFVGTSVASAREYGTAPLLGGLSENPDGTWSFYYAGAIAPVATYSAEEHELLRRLAKGLEVRTGSTGQSATEVSGLGAGESAADSSMAKMLETEQLYKSEAEANLGDAVIAEDETEGTLPTAAAILAAAETIEAHAGPFRVAMGLGGERYALETLQPLGLNEGIENVPAPKSNSGYQRDTIDHYIWGYPLTVTPRGGLAHCENFISGSEGPEGLYRLLIGNELEQFCENANLVREEWVSSEQLVCEPSCHWVYRETAHSQYKVQGWGGGYQPRCPTGAVPCYARPYESGEALEGAMILKDSHLKPGAFPAPHLNRFNSVTEGRSSMSPMTSLSTPIPPSSPTVGTTTFVNFILEQQCHSLLPGIEGACPHAPRGGPPSGFGGPGGAPGEPGKIECYKSDPVNCATGNESYSQTDLSVGGRGPALALTLTYNSGLALDQLSGHASGPGPFGYGWTSSFSAHLELGPEAKLVTVYEDDGHGASYVKNEGTYSPTAALNEATLVKEGAAYTYTLPSQTKYKFAATTGRLESITDRNGNSASVSYSEAGRLETVTGASGRKLTFAYNGEGLVESVKDPMGHVVKYGYTSKQLSKVTLPGATSTSWEFKYNETPDLTSIANALEHTWTIAYDTEGRVKSETDPMSHKREWAYSYAGTPETTLSEPNGSTTDEVFGEQGEPLTVTRAVGTGEASTTTYGYDSAGRLTGVVNPDGNITTYTYDSAGDRTSETNPLHETTSWAYNGQHELTSTTTPSGETTTIKRDAHGNVEAIERPVSETETQKTTYEYDAHGDVTSMKNPLEHVWKYEYDANGDCILEEDPEHDKQTWGYDEDSFVTSSVSPRGHVAGTKEANFTTKIERDAQERLKTVTDPLKNTTKTTYNADGGIELVEDGNKQTTTYSYNLNDERIKVKEPNGVTAETEYNAEGQVVAQSDGSKHTTKYARNLLGEVTEVTDPRSRVTTKEYDKAGNLTKLTDPMKRTTTYTYDSANELTKVSYSDGKTPNVTYEYDADGNRVGMSDGTGTTTYKYDRLDRLTEAKDGHGHVIDYKYNLASQQEQLTYPNGKSITRAFDNDGRLKSVTDWEGRKTSFGYDADSDLASIAYPSGTSDEDLFEYDRTDRMEVARFKKSSETLASLTYTRDSDGQVKSVTQTGLPGEEKETAKYDEADRLTKWGTTSYEYDAGNNATKIGTTSLSYNAADEIEKAGTVTYAYDEDGERTSSSPPIAASTSYGYNQASDLTTVLREKEGANAAIEDSYGYNGDGLRTSQTISGATSYWAWDVSAALPLLLSDETNSFIYGPEGLPVEQINNSTGTVTYLHHDQQGSTRLLTGSTGKVEGKCTYSPYGVPTCEGTATTPLGYDGQYTSSDTGLIYMRARVYDPGTAQFLTVDPIVARTLAPYNYAGDNPVNEQDRTGLEEETGYCIFPLGCVSGPGGNGGGGHGIEVVKEIAEKNWHEFENGAERVGEAVEGVWNEVTGQGGTSEPLPPGYNPEWERRPASREKAGENWWDPEGGEWHWDPDRHGNHPEFPEGHWDYKPPYPRKAAWQRLPPC